eukprot:2574269-Amphidinium_carterae.1
MPNIKNTTATCSHLPCRLCNEMLIHTHGPRRYFGRIPCTCGCWSEDCHTVVRSRRVAARFCQGFNMGGRGLMGLDKWFPRYHNADYVLVMPDVDHRADRVLEELKDTMDMVFHKVPWVLPPNMSASIPIESGGCLSLIHISEPTRPRLI